MINPFYALELNSVGEPHTKIALLAGFLPNIDQQLVSSHLGEAVSGGGNLTGLELLKACLSAANTSLLLESCAYCHYVKTNQAERRTTK